MRKVLSFLFLIFLLVFCLEAQTFTFEQMIKMRRVGNPALSPDGKTVAFTIGDVDKAANRTLTHIYTVAIDGTNLKQITKGEKSHSSPRWSPDGKKLAFVSGGQIWTMDPDGDNKKQITKISTGASNPVWSPNGKMIAFTSEVYPNCKDDACNAAEDKKNEESKVKAIVTDRLLYRHWDEWRDKKRTHVFIVFTADGTIIDLTPGDFDSPPYGAASGVDFAFSPDSKEIAILKNLDKVEAVSTNSDIFTMPIPGVSTSLSSESIWENYHKSVRENTSISAENGIINITKANKGYDASPTYTPNGKYILFRSQATEGFEADRWRIMRYDRKTKEIKELTAGFDEQADQMILSPDSTTIYFTANFRGHEPIYSVPLEPNFNQRIATHVKQVRKDGFFGNLNITPDGNNFVAVSSSLTAPAEVFKIPVNGDTMTNLSKANAPTNLKPVEELDWTGAMGAKVHGFLVKPMDFDSSKKYPLIVLIHGGPQAAWNNNWGYRWNAQVFANAGYIVFLPNPRGSTGYGQKFVNEISGDWGGKVFDDIKNGVAEVLKKNSYIDKERIGAAGASYGGYMVNWILGHNDDLRFKFKALVSHAGVYNLESMAGATEELWFVIYEFKGMPWQNKSNYERWSPHKFAAKFNTPTLVTQGEIDYRVPVDQSLQLFTALQLKGVDSRLIVFPDEGHWILKPQNSELWYSNVLAWFNKYLKP